MASVSHCQHASVGLQKFEQEIDCLDLLPGFRTVVERDGARLYMERGDMHFNVAGQALAAEVIADHICSSSDTIPTSN